MANNEALIEWMKHMDKKHGDWGKLPRTHPDIEMAVELNPDALKKRHRSNQKRKRKWSVEEDQYIRDNYLEVTDEQLGKDIGVKDHAVTKRRRVLGLVKQPKWNPDNDKYLIDNYLSESDRIIGERLGVSRHIVYQRREELGLKMISKAKKKINQYDLDGNFIRTHENIYAASESLGVSRQTITNVLRGRQKTSAGYLWKYTHLEEGEQDEK